MKSLLRIGSSGITLFEMLVALALVGLMATFIANAMSITIATDRYIDRLEVRHHAIGARARLRSILARAETQPLPFSGTEKRFQFSTDVGLSTNTHRKPAFCVVVLLEGGLEVTLYEDAQLKEEISSDKISISDAQVEFAYFDPRSSPQIWQNTWTYSDRMPMLVSISPVDGKMTAEWPPFIVRLQLAR